MTVVDKYPSEGAEYPNITLRQIGAKPWKKPIKPKVKKKLKKKRKDED